MNYNQMKTSDIAKELIAMVEEKHRKEALVTDINKEISHINTVLVDRMDEEDMTVLVTADGVKLERITDEQFKLNIEEKWDEEGGSFHRWLKEIGEDGVIKTKSSVHSATRDKFLKERRADGKDLPSFIDVGFFNRIKYNNAELKRRALSGAESKPE